MRGRDQIVTIERLSQAPDGAGGVIATWSPLRSTWASVRPKSGAERMTDGRIAATFVTVFVIRRMADLTEMDRIEWRGVIYNIRGILRESARQNYLWIEAERGTV
jgi:SPP1 family predicted phage head-tail adaptor